MASIIGLPLRVLPSDDLNEGGTATAEKLFEDTSNNKIVLYAPSGGQLAGANSKKAWQGKVRAGGRVTGGTTTNFTVKLYFGTAFTTSDTVIEASTARAVNSESENWAIEADIVVDSTSNKINGRGWSQVGNLVDAYAALDNQATFDPDLSTTTYGFTVSGTFSSGNASNVAYLDYFELESSREG